jgi:hypothetical protein
MENATALTIACAIAATVASVVPNGSEHYRNLYLESNALPNGSDQYGNPRSASNCAVVSWNGLVPGNLPQFFAFELPMGIRLLMDLNTQPVRGTDLIQAARNAGCDKRMSDWLNPSKVSGALLSGGTRELLVRKIAWSGCNCECDGVRPAEMR